jgi:hypothetical protein
MKREIEVKENFPKTHKWWHILFTGWVRSRTYSDPPSSLKWPDEICHDFYECTRCKAFKEVVTSTWM